MRHNISVININTLCILATSMHKEKYMQALNFMFEGPVVESLTWEIS